MMNNYTKEYGIWGGRFQIIHRGHEYVLKYVANNYSKVCIGIVNPNPIKPAWSVAEHEKFDPVRNPLSYFERMYLWRMVLRENSIEAVIVPHWHPRKSLNLEKTFLPSVISDREWIIPNMDGEEYKIEDFINAGESVYVLNDVPPELRPIHASVIMERFKHRDRFYKEDIPICIQEITDVFLNRKELGRDFLIVPIWRDNLHANLFCGSIKKAFDCNKDIIFAPIINVQDEEEWWKFEPVESVDSFFSFYKKYEIINDIMRYLKFYDYYVIPLISRRGVIQDIDAFFPKKNRRNWLVIKNVNTCYDLREIIRCERIIRGINPCEIPSDLFLSVSTMLYQCFQEKRQLLSILYKEEDDGNDNF